MLWRISTTTRPASGRMDDIVVILRIQRSFLP